MEIKVPVTPQGIIAQLVGYEYEAACRLLELAERLGLKCEVKQSRGAARIVYSVARPRRGLMTVDCKDGRLRVKANLFHLDAYTREAHAAPEAVRSIIKTSRACRSCNPNCAGRSPYTLDGEQYLPCYGYAHFFMFLKQSEWESLETLIELESKAP